MARTVLRNGESVGKDARQSMQGMGHPVWKGAGKYTISSTQEERENRHMRRYAIVGLGDKEVEVIEWADGRGLEEVTGGHKGAGVENTRVCVRCTTERIQIIMCSNHELILLPSGANNDKVDENDAFEELLSCSGRLKGRWCSICPNLARYQCCTAGDEGAGCGLLAFDSWPISSPSWGQSLGSPFSHSIQSNSTA